MPRTGHFRLAQGFLKNYGRGRKPLKIPTHTIKKLVWQETNFLDRWSRGNTRKWLRRRKKGNCRYGRYDRSGRKSRKPVASSTSHRLANLRRSFSPDPALAQALPVPVGHADPIDQSNPAPWSCTALVGRCKQKEAWRSFLWTISR